jgi:hypothetical protein
MINFLKQMQIPDNAITIYTNCLGKPPLTYSEIYSFMPSLPQEDFSHILNDLVEVGLIIQIMPQKPEILLHYIAIPPITAILNFYSNINKNINNIQDAVMGLITSSLNQLFQDKKHMDLEEVQNNFNKIKRDLLEDVLIQRQDAKELVENFQSIKKLKDILSHLTKILFEIKQVQSNSFEKLKDANNVQMEYLINNLNKIKLNLVEKIKGLELKKKEEIVLEAIENIFNNEVRNMITELISNTNTIIEEEFKEAEESMSKTFSGSINKEVIEPMDKIISEAQQAQNDFNLMFLNVVSNFEKVVSEIQKIIKKDREQFITELENLKEEVIKTLNDIIIDSLNQVCGLSKPIENTLQQFMDANLLSYKAGINNLWFINSELKIKEEINNIIINSTENITIIVPKLESFLNLNYLKALNKNPKIKVAASEPITNSIVKNFKEIKNLEYRSLANDSIIALNGDDKHIILCIINKNTGDPLNNIIGFGSNYTPLIQILSGIINTSWAAAESEVDMSVKKTPKPSIKIAKAIPTTVPLPHEISTKQEIKTETKKVTSFTPTKSTKKISATSKPERSEEIPSQKPDIVTQSTQQPNMNGDNVLNIFPKPGDQSGVLINTAFNMLISKLNTLNGSEFSKELQNISDLILERKGFSVTLHDVRRITNKFKDNINPLTENDTNEIKQSIATWKHRLY